MPLDWNADDDFAAVIDGLEEVSWQPTVGSPVTLVAWRREQAWTDNDGSPGGAWTARTIWDLPWPSGSLPKIGEMLTDSASRVWSIVSVAPLRNDTRVRCGTVLV